MAPAAGDQVRSEDDLPDLGTELVERRDANTEVFANADGTETVRVSSTPVHFQPEESTAWEEIDNTLAADPTRPGWVKNTANDWTVRFGPVTPGGAGGVELTTDAGVARFAPELPATTTRVITPVVGTADDAATVTYDDVWPGVDVKYTVTSIRVKEELVVHDGSRSSFPFVAEGFGLVEDAPAAASPIAEAAAGTGLDDKGSVLGVVPQVTGAQAGQLSFAPIEVVGVDGKLVGPEAGADLAVLPAAATPAPDAAMESQDAAELSPTTQHFEVSVDEEWMADQADEDEPVVIDPSVVVHATDSLKSYEYRTDLGYQVGYCECGARTGMFGSSIFRTVAKFPYWNAIAGRDVLYAGIWLSNRSLGLKDDDDQWVPWTMAAWDADEVSPDFHGAVHQSGEDFWKLDEDMAGATVALDVTAHMNYLMLTQDPNGMFGLSGEEDYEASISQFDTVILVMSVNTKPPAPSLVSPAANSLQLGSSTPTLRWNPSASGSVPHRDVDNDRVKYVAQITTGADGGSGLVASSPILEGTEWTVPAGVLQNGTTYYWKVRAGDFEPDTSTTAKSWVDSEIRKLTFDSGVGSGGLSPTDSFGGMTTNLVTGNGSLSVAGATMPSVGGGVGVQFRYDGHGEQFGLTGTYSVDSNNNNEIDASDEKKLVRRDASINFSWPKGTSPSPAVPEERFNVRWSGSVRMPADKDWVFGVISDDGMRVKIDGATVINSWVVRAAPATPDWESGSHRSTTPLPLSVDFFEATEGATAQLWVHEVGSMNAFPVPSDWLLPAVPEMPTGWSMQAADANVVYVRSQVSESSVTLTAGDGSTYSFAKQPSGQYTPPEGVDDIVSVNPDGSVTVQDDAGFTYNFRNDGGLEQMVQALDDRKPAAALSSYDSLGRVTKIVDPVSGRPITFTYAASSNDSACPDNPSSSDFKGSPPDVEEVPGMLCKVSYWDGTSTDLFYSRLSDRLLHIRNPGKAYWGFSYDTHGRLVGYHDPTAFDVSISGDRTDSVLTTLSYLGCPPWVPPGSMCRQPNQTIESVTLPKALAGDTTRPQHAYSYAMSVDGGTLLEGTAAVTRAGVSGTYLSVKYDRRGRTTESTNGVPLTTRSYWDSHDMRVATETPDSPENLLTATVFNARHQPTDVWGPAPRSAFTWLLGIYPVPDTLKPGQSTCTNGTWSAACPIPHSINRYDEGIDGLAVTWWNAIGQNGSAVAHSHDPGVISGPISLPAGVNSETISARYSGDITMLGSGGYTFNLCVDPGNIGTLYVGTTKVLEIWNVTTAVKCGEGPYSNFWPGVTLPIRIDFSDFALDNDNDAHNLGLGWLPPGGSWSPVPGSQLKPGFGLRTSATDADGKNTVSEYTDPAAGVGPQHGLVVRSTVDPGGLALTTATGYEAAGTGFLRTLTTTLPAGAATTTTKAYYGADNPNTTGTNEAETRNIPSECGGGSNVNQGGRMKTDTSADPDGAGAAVAIKRELIYDAAGRIVATRTGTEPWTCTSYDSRGRVTTVAYPAHFGQPARTVSHSYQVDPDGTGSRPATPLVTSVSDAAGTITSETDLVGRNISYVDVWGKSAAFTYDPAGREMWSWTQAGFITKSYDGGDRLTQIVRDNKVLANGFNYDPVSGRLVGVSYPSDNGNGAGNNTSGTFDYDTSTGQLRKITWTGPGGVLTSNEVGRTLGGEIVNELTDNVDPNTAGNNYVYDNAGRLTEAWVPGRRVQYGYGNNGATCAIPNMAAGKNANRTSQTIVGGTSTTYCYDHADRLTGSSDSAVGGTPSYDSHGNTTGIFSETRTYDVADRHMTTAKGGTTVAYRRDATDRIVERKVNGAIVARYGATGSDDAPEFTMDALGNTVEITYSLPGGAMLTTRSGGNVWSYPNIHGDVAAVADQSGAKQGATTTYDPFGNLTSPPTTLPDNSAGNFDYGWLGQHLRPLEHEGTMQPVIEMGVRQYSPLLGRFIEVDPEEGGSCNDYDYVCSNPIKGRDLDGRNKCEVGANPLRWAGNAQDCASDAMQSDRVNSNSFIQAVCPICTRDGRNMLERLGLCQVCTRAGRERVGRQLRGCYKGVIGFLGAGAAAKGTWTYVIKKQGKLAPVKAVTFKALVIGGCAFGGARQWK